MIATDRVGPPCSAWILRGGTRSTLPCDPVVTEDSLISA
jgi:hypothetical protein